jgi:hypothetical protein
MAVNSPRLILEICDLATGDAQRESIVRDLNDDGAERGVIVADG